MPGHDIIVLGASAGGINALAQLVGGLPARLPAAIFVAIHIPTSGPDLLPEILSRACALPAAHARDGASIECGRIYVAPPDHHMLIEPGHIHVVRGPKENGFRPAIDATLRTAARVRPARGGRDPHRHAGRWDRRSAGAQTAPRRSDRARAGRSAVSEHAGQRDPLCRGRCGAAACGNIRGADAPGERASRSG